MCIMDMPLVKKYENIIFLVLITMLALITRYYMFPKESGDYYQFLLP